MKVHQLLTLASMAVLMAISTVTIAHGPTRQKVSESIEINASAEKVWDVIKDFGVAHTWLPMVESTENAGGNATVTWKGAFYRGYPNNDPPPELNDEAAVAAVTGVYQAGLAHLKELVESQ